MKSVPNFWKKKTIINYIIALPFIPFSFIFLIAGYLRNVKIKPRRFNEKIVVCVGNASVGGAGKTPTAIVVFKILNEMG